MVSSKVTKGIRCCICLRWSTFPGCEFHWLVTRTHKYKLTKSWMCREWSSCIIWSFHNVLEFSSSGSNLRPTLISPSSYSPFPPFHSSFWISKRVCCWGYMHWGNMGWMGAENPGVGGGWGGNGEENGRVRQSERCTLTRCCLSTVSRTRGHDTDDIIQDTFFHSRPVREPGTRALEKVRMSTEDCTSLLTPLCRHANRQQ